MNISENQKIKAEKFLALHKSEKLLVLPNIWDASSAKLFELEGFNALGTTSAGIAAVFGYPDGEIMKFEESINLLNRIVASTVLPVSIDIESGYSDRIDEITDLVKKVIEIGAVGINIEDSKGGGCSCNGEMLYPIEEQSSKISEIRKLSNSLNFHLVINARSDELIVSNENLNSKLNKVIERGNRYSEAGADCIFVLDSGELSKENIKCLVKEINCPINLIINKNSPPFDELEQLGVSRISFGPKIMRTTFDLIRTHAKQLKEKNVNEINNCKITYSEVNNWFCK